MKKSLILLCLLLALCLSLLPACGADNAQDGDPLADKALADIMTELTADLENMPMTMEQPLDEETFAFYSFVEYEEGYEGLASEAAIGSIAHSIVLVRVPDGADAAAVAASMEENMDPRKWICVEAEKAAVMQAGNTILLVMTRTEVADTVLQNFSDMTGVAVPK